MEYWCVYVYRYLFIYHVKWQYDVIFYVSIIIIFHEKKMKIQFWKNRTNKLNFKFKSIQIKDENYLLFAIL